jgi:hypothetical protein
MGGFLVPSAPGDPKDTGEISVLGPPRGVADVGASAPEFADAADPDERRLRSRHPMRAVDRPDDATRQRAQPLVA